MRILVTGGAGYIGSHTALELLGAGHDVVVVVPEEFHPLSHLSRSARPSRAVSEDPGSTSPIRRDRPCAGPRENLYSNIGCFPLVFQV